MNYYPKYIIYFSLMFAFISANITLHAQSGNIRKKNRQADELFEKQDYLNAYQLYDEIIHEDSSDMHIFYQAGLCLFKLGRTDTATFRLFLKASQKENDARYYLGRLYHLKDNLTEAMNEYIRFEIKYTIDSEISYDELKRWKAICKNGIEQKMNEQDLQVNPLGSNINTSYPEYAPFLSNDEQILVFTSRRETSTGNDKDAYDNYYEDIYYSKKEGNYWSKAKPFSVNINTMTHDAGVTFTPDGAIIFYRTDEKKTGGDLYISHRTSDDWQEATILTSHINSEYCEPSACFSPSGEIIIFSSDKPGGYGGRDLYRVIKFSDSIYSLPLNLGPKINTEYDEDAPFISGDTMVLYFSSKGHNTLGGYDIFKAEFDSTRMPGKPVNIGEPFNSPADDIYYVVTRNGETCYFSSNRSGNSDIYESNLNLHNYHVITGRINVEENKVIDLSKIIITVTEEPSGKLNGIYRLKKNYNTFILVANRTKEYKITVESPEIKTLVDKMKLANDEINITVKIPAVKKKNK